MTLVEGAGAGASTSRRSPWCAVPTKAANDSKSEASGFVSAKPAVNMRCSRPAAASNSTSLASREGTR
eukprot:5495886-Alexandrium_andersonii.AAC.1